MADGRSILSIQRRRPGVLTGGGRRLYLVAPAPEEGAESLADVFLVVGDEDGRGAGTHWGPILADRSGLATGYADDTDAAAPRRCGNSGDRVFVWLGETGHGRSIARRRGISSWRQRTLSVWLSRTAAPLTAGC